MPLAVQVSILFAIYTFDIWMCLLLLHNNCNNWTWSIDFCDSEGTYKFRVAAVYSNNDNKHGPTSKKFTLKTAPYSEPQAPEGAPVIVEVKPVEFQKMHGLNVKWNVSSWWFIDAYV